MKLNILISFFFLSFLTACMEDNIPTIVDNITYETTNLLLQDFESKGDFINKTLDHYFITVDHLHQNINKYKIIDVRNEIEFNKGHIQSSINIIPTQLIEYFSNKKNELPQKYVLVSSTGQKAAFCFSVLKLLGYKDIFILDYGLSCWNNDFSQIWRNAIGSDTKYFEGNAQAKAYSYGLPELEKIEISELHNFIRNRAQQTLALKFDENNSEFNNEESSISWLMTDSLYYYLSVNMKGDIISVLKTDTASVICFGNWDQYLINGSGYLRRSHPSYAWLYKIFDGNHSNFQSNEHLQNIPLHTRIIIYSYNGQRSAMSSAYLRMLGFNACSIVFGSCNMQYNDMFNTPDLRKYIFTDDKIRNYNYISN